jgi:hypothetical protein
MNILISTGSPDDPIDHSKFPPIYSGATRLSYHVRHAILLFSFSPRSYQRVICAKKRYLAGEQPEADSDHPQKPFGTAYDPHLCRNRAQHVQRKYFPLLYCHSTHVETGVLTQSTKGVAFNKSNSTRLYISTNDKEFNQLQNVQEHIISGRT